VVSRSAQVRRRAPRRFRHGHRARRSLDLWPGTRTRNESVPENALPAVSINAQSRGMIYMKRLLVLSLVLSLPALAQRPEYTPDVPVEKWSGKTIVLIGAHADDE